MAIRLAEDRRRQLLLAVEGFFAEELDEEISAFRAEQVLDFFLETLGPPVYNQAVQDARDYVQRKLEELEGEVYASDAF